MEDEACRPQMAGCSLPPDERHCLGRSVQHQLKHYAGVKGPSCGRLRQTLLFRRKSLFAQIAICAPEADHSSSVVNGRPKARLGLGLASIISDSEDLSGPENDPPETHHGDSEVNRADDEHGQKQVPGDRKIGPTEEYRLSERYEMRRRADHLHNILQPNRHALHWSAAA